MKQLIDQYAAYNLWANTRLVERLQREPDALLDRHVKSSFPGLRATVLHIRDSSSTWHVRAFGAERAAAGNGIDSLLQVSVALRDRVLALGGADLGAMVAYTTAKGQACNQPRWQLLMHCFNHATYHRGQVVTIMRQLDLQEIPAMDLVVYQRLSPGM
ncbi:MAG: hypothetical protein JSS84_02995 [Bacteroidetes bacterium]|nr:hypothetical protein [Bacteroidota bacterium]